MPTEAKKLIEVSVAIMESEDGTRYLHATGDGVIDYIVLWNSQMRQAQEELRTKIINELEKEYGGWVTEVIEKIKKIGTEDETSANDEV